MDLYINNTIIMNAPAHKVWQVLTDASLSQEWISTWWPDFELLESTWNLGSAVLWRTKGGVVGAQGVVTEVRPFTLLKFTFKPQGQDAPIDRITYELSEKGGFTTLFVSIGNFADTIHHKQSYDKTMEHWDRALPKIKELSES
ncbi:MAG TPA: SRPBCC domain-containing protein [Cytophagales bacterium]|nr:SRPBCC domain-containing protein [Cytophagales bacterium]